MDYDGFRVLWHKALFATGLLSPSVWPTETVDLRSMDRKYSIIIHMHDMERVRPFHVAVELSWRWDVLQSARTATREEDLLVELLGEDGYYLVTERPWVRIDATLSATLPRDAPIPMPDAGLWQRWTREVAQRMSPLMPVEQPEVRADRGAVLLFWRDDPVARGVCSPDGRLHLTGVELSAWQGIELSRQWDNSDRPPDYGTEAQLDSFCRWLCASLKVWEESLLHFTEKGTR